jgi:hypothetical protein
VVYPCWRVTRPMGVGLILLYVAYAVVVLMPRM